MLGFLRLTRETLNLVMIKCLRTWKLSLEKNKVSLLGTQDLRVKKNPTKHIKCQISDSKITWVSNCVAKMFAQIIKEIFWTTATAKIWTNFSKRTAAHLSFKRIRKYQRRWKVSRCLISHLQITIKIVLTVFGSCSMTTFPVVTNMKDSVIMLRRWNSKKSTKLDWTFSNK